MNWDHLRTFVWLRVRLRRNRMMRAGTASFLTEAVVSALAIIAACLMFLMGLALGVLALATTPPASVMWVWDGYIGAFLFFWMTELMVELQRADIFSFEKFLHLPVSPSSLFLINYISSFSCVSVNLFLPGMMGLSIGLVFSRGPIMSFLIVVTAAFFVMVTAVTYQFRGWLASLMENKRRRRNIIAIVTMLFVLMTQMPSVLIWATRPKPSAQTAAREEVAKLDRLLAQRQIDTNEYQQRADAIYKKYGVRKQEPGQARQDILRIATTVNQFVPLGWPAYAALTTVQRNIVPAVLVAIGMSFVGALSLIRAYRTTLRLYTGEFTGKHQVPRARAPKTTTPSAAFLEKRLPWISEHASAIALAGLRSLMRAPEAKMMLLTPITFVGVFGLWFMRAGSNPSEIMRPAIASAATVMILFGMTQLAGNQFGVDRSGFRAFVLAPALRRDILLGKNLSLLPFALGLELLGAVVLQLAYPMRIDYFLAVVLQTISLYLVFCIQMNFLSMLAPMALPAGSLKPAKPKGVSILIHLASFILFPAFMGLTVFPLGVEFLLRPSRAPVYLLLTLIEVVLVAYAYPRILALQSRLLEMREQKILEIVAARPD